MVRCFLLEKGAEAQTKSLRFVPYNEFELWKYMMGHKYRFIVLEAEESLWIDDDERARMAGIYDKFRAERVHQVRLLRYLDKARMFVPIHRYFPEQDYDRRKKFFVNHYDAEISVSKSLGFGSPVEETPGWWIARREAAKRRNTDSFDDSAVLRWIARER
jgi:hypothetical protein